MAISDPTQTLSAAFSLGILLQAAITALLLYLKGHETKLSQDRRRLALVVFLLFAALWAQLDFISFLVPTSKTSACRAATIISSLFDQIARAAIGAYLLFSIGRVTKSASEKYLLGGLVSLRVVIGIVFAVLTRPQFAPLCIAQSSSTAVAIIPIILDVIIIGVVAIRILQLGLMRNRSSQDRQNQSKALTFVTIGFTIWTATSVPMELGLSDIILLVRTAIPATGLTLLISMLTLFPGALISSQGEDDTVSEAQSPFRPDPPRALGSLYNNSSDRSGSPVVHVGYGKNGRLFVTNPSDTPRDSPTGPFQMIKGEDVKVRVAEVREIGGESSLLGASGVVGAAPAAALAFGSGASVSAVPAPSAQQKKSLFSRSKVAARPNIRALGISQPVLDESSANNPEAPFARMQTIDLATAAANERSRRENAANRTLQNPRSAPMPPAADEGLRRSTSTKRKEIPKAKHEPMPSISSQSTDSSSADSIISSDISTNVANASSTSSSLSPNRDEVRRRSPRHATLEEKQTYPMPPQLQKKLMVGLPTGPRSTLMPTRQQIVVPKAATVMLLNDIVYDNPNQVNSLMNFTRISPGAPIMKTKDLERDFRDSDTIPADALPEYNNTMSTIRSMEYNSTMSTIRSIEYNSSISTVRSMEPKEHNSIMERPRPYKKDRVKSRGLFPRDISEDAGLNRRRSKSTGSLGLRKSLIISRSDSPTNLPALPPPPVPQPPTTAAKLAKILSKSSLGMTADEKISMLFPAPPGNLSKRRSSVPSIPSMLIDEMILMSPPRSPTLAIGGRSLPVADAPESPIERRETYRFSANTYQTITRSSEDEDEDDLPGLPTSNYTFSAPTYLLPNPPPFLKEKLHPEFTSTVTPTVPSVRSSDATEPVAIPLSKPSTTILRKPLNSEYEDVVPVSATEFDDEEASVIFEPQEAAFEGGKESSLFDDEESEDEEQEIETPTGEDNATAGFKNISWHRRIGDDLPTFSDRGDMSRPRAMPPPPPLLLNPAGRNAAVVVRVPEPEQVDSPSRAIAEIQAQLKRFEERDRASVGSLLRKFPADESINQAGVPADDGRRELLESLEKEMGLQENAWMEMQHNYDRDSTSSILSPSTLPDEQVRPTLSREPSDASSVSFRSSSIASRSVERMSRLRRGSISKQNQSPELIQDRATMWQQRLAQAQEEFTEKAPELQRKRSRNFLSIKPVIQQSDSQIRPESRKQFEAEYPEKFENEDEVYKATIVPKTKVMWQPSPPASEQRISLMWEPLATPSERSTTPEPPALFLRPAQRRNLGSLSHSSSSLWMKPAKSGLSATRPIVGLWGSRTARPKSIQTRPVTQRPARKSKRMTFLPDIVESPSPLPHKRDTLGLYQFPWGEKSDSAVYRPPVNPALSMAQPILKPVLEARARELESEEYSSSFFDDYDEEFNNYRDEEMDSDDDFDESTLWEIASLLKTQEGVPSRGSLLSQDRDVIDDYEYDDYDEEFEDGPMYVEDRLHFEPVSRLALNKSSLWIGNDETNAEIKAAGLAQPPTPVWESYIPPSEDTVRSKPKTEVPLASLASKQLWESEPTVPDRHTFCLWNPDLKNEEAPAAIDIQIEPSAPREEVIQYAPLPRTVFVQPVMWKRSKTELEPENSGLFEHGSRRSVYRTTLASPVAKNVRIQRASTLNVPSLESTNLWAAPSKSGERHASWIETSAVAAVAVSSSTTGMWMAPGKSPMVTTLGLFSPGNVVARTSEKEPAAQGMTLKSRKLRASLPPLTSRRLWCSDNLIMIERDWISESSVRPTSPSIYSLSSGATSPASDRSSINSVASTSTKASSIWSTMSATATAAVVTKPGWAIPKRKQAPPMPSMPEKKDEEDKSQSVSKLPVRQNSQKLPAPAARRESKVLANAALFESRAQNEKTAARMTMSANRRSTFGKKCTPPPSKPVYVPLRQQFRPIFIANWDAALEEAIAAGSRKKVQVDKKSAGSGLVRHKIPSAEWDVALELAIAAGSQKTAHSISQGKPQFVRSKWTPVDWEMALSNAIAQGHPRLQPPKATQAMWLNALTEAMGQTSRTTTHMWTPPSIKPTVTKSNSMWQVPASSSPVRRSIFDAVKGETLRKAKPSRIASLEKLTTSSFWRKEDRAKATAKNWLHTSRLRVAARQMLATQVSDTTISKEPLSFTWTKPTESVTSSSTTSMWSKSAQSQDIFTNPLIQTMRRAKPSSSAPLPRLISTSFWQRSQLVASSPLNWIQAAKSTASESAQPLTLAHPHSKAIPSSGSSLWKSGDVTCEDIFAGVKCKYYRKRAVTRPAKLPELSSNSLWQPTASIPMPCNWLNMSQYSITSTIAAPAMVELALTWIAPLGTTSKDSPIEEPMWSHPNTSADKRRSIFSNVSITTIRKNLSREKSLPKLKSKQLFEPANDKDLSDVHWLYVLSKTLHTPVDTLHVNCEFIAQTTPELSTVEEMDGTWTPPTNIDKNSSSNDFALWTVPDFNSYDHRQSLFSELTVEHINKAQSSRPVSELPKLESESFWQPSTSESSEEVNWIKASASAKTSSSTPPSLSISPSSLNGTWTPHTTSPSPVPSATATNAKMWDSYSNPFSPSIPTLFSNPHTGARVPAKRSVEPLKAIESVELWRPSRNVPESPRNWLVMRRFSRVQFRY